MESMTTFESAFRVTWPRVTFRRRGLASFAGAVGLGAAVAFAVATDRGAPVPPAPQAATAKGPLPYVSSDPSVPPADTVKFPDAQPPVEAF